MNEQLDEVDFAKGDGLVPVIVQDYVSGQVYMLGYQNREALERSLETGHLHLWSRSRGELWPKGQKSGNYLLVRRLTLDCDGDTILARVEQATGTTRMCHTGADTCFITLLTRVRSAQSTGKL